MAKTGMTQSEKWRAGLQRLIRIAKLGPRDLPFTPEYWIAEPLSQSLRTNPIEACVYCGALRKKKTGVLCYWCGEESFRVGTGTHHAYLNMTKNDAM